MLTTTDLYRNLTRGCWSLRQGGRVVGHAAAAALADVSLHASEPARQRFLRTGHRTVHAWARGTLWTLQRRVFPHIRALKFIVGWRVSV